MKKQQHESQLVYVEDIVYQANQYISQSHQACLKEATHIAQMYANKNLPTVDEVAIEPFIPTIIGKYSALKKDISVLMQGSLQKFYSSLSLAPLDEKIETTKDAITKQSYTLTNLETDKSQLTMNSHHSTHNRRTWLLPLFGLADSLLMVNCFLKLGDIVLIAFIVGIIIGFAQVYATETATLWIREITDAAKRKRYYRVALIAVIILSWALGTIRFYFAHTGVAAGIPFYILNPFLFAALNMLLIIASALVVHFYFPTIAQRQKQKQIENIDRQIKKSISHKHELEAQYDQLVNKRVQAKKVNEALVHNQAELFKKINAHFLEAVGKFIQENVIKRTDGNFPLCFKQHNILLHDNEIPKTTFLLTDK